MNSWLNKKYFLIAAGLMSIVQVSKFIDGKSSLIEALLAIVFGGFFWGVIATFIAKKISKQNGNKEL